MCSSDLELYGCGITVTIGDSFRGDTVSLNDVMQCLNKFKPLDLKKYRDGFCSFRLASYIDKNENKATIESIKPLTIKLSNPTYGSPSAKLCYYTMINKKIVQLCFYIPSNLAGHISYNRHDVRGGFYIDNVNCVNNIGGNSIVWGRGSNDSVNDVTIYNIDAETIAHKIAQQ